MKTVFRLVFLRAIPALCVIYVLYFLALGGLHTDMRAHDIEFVSVNCPSLSAKVGPLEIEERTVADWSPFVTEYRYVEDLTDHTSEVFEIARRNDLSALSCFPLFTCLLPPEISKICEIVE